MLLGQDDLLIVAAVDAAGVSRGMQDAVSAVQQGTRRIDDVLSQVSGADVAAGTVRRLNTELNEATTILRRMAGEIELAGFDEGDVGALRALVDEQRTLAAAIGATEGQVRELDQVMGAIDGRAFDDALAAARSTEEGVRALNREIRESNQLLAIAARGTDVRSEVDVEGIREAIQQQREWLVSIQATIPQLAQLGEIERRFEDQVQRVADGALADQQRALSTSIREVGLYGRQIDATNATAVAAWREEVAAVRAQAGAIGASREQLLRLDAVVRQVEQSFERQEAAARGATTSSGLGPLINDAGRFTSVGQRLGSTFVGVAFGLEAIAREGNAADAGLRTALRSVASFAAFLGPQGLLVSGAAAGAAALLDLADAHETAAEAAQRHEEQLRGVQQAATSALAGVRNLTTAQASMRRITIADDLRQANATIRDLRKEITEAFTERGPLAQAFGVFDGATDRIIRLTGTAYERFQRGSINAEQFAASIAEVGAQDPNLTARARDLADLVMTYGSAKESADALRGALNEVNAATRLPDQPLETSLATQLAERQALTEAYRRGGEVERDAWQLASQAFTEWKAERAGTVDQTITLTQALQSQTGDVQAHAEAILRDARSLASMNAEARLLETSVERAAARLRDLGSRVNATLASSRQLGAAGDQIQLAIERGRLENTVTRHLAAQVDQYGAAAVALRGILADLREYETTASRIKPLATEGIFAAPRVEPIVNIRSPGQNLIDQARSAGPSTEAITRARAFRFELSGIATGARGVLQVADAFGRVDDSVRRSLDGVLAIVSSAGQASALLQKITDANKAAGIAEKGSIGDLFTSVQGITSVIGIIGGAAGLIGGLLNQGPSPMQVALQSNEQALERLRHEVSGLTVTMANLARVEAAARRIGAAPLDFNESVFQPLRGDRGAIDAYLADLGLTFRDLTQIAEQYGIDLLDSNGRIVLPAMEQLAEAMDLARQAALRWQNDLSGIRDQQDLRNQIYDVEDSPLQALRDAGAQLRALTQGSGLYELLFGGLDTASAEGRALLEQRMRDFVDRLLADDTQLQAMLEQTGFQSIDELRDWLLGADAALDQFTDTVRGASAELSNIPTGFKRIIDQIRYEVSDAGPRRPAEIALPVAPEFPELFPIDDLVAAIQPRSRLVGTALDGLVLAVEEASSRLAVTVPQIAAPPAAAPPPVVVAASVAGQITTSTRGGERVVEQVDQSVTFEGPVYVTTDARTARDLAADIKRQQNLEARQRVGINSPERGSAT